MSEVRLVVAILVPAIFTLILKDFFDLFMTNRYEGKVKQYTIWMLYFLLDTAISMNFKFVGVISMLYSFIILTINEQIQNIAQKKDTLCRRMYN